MTNTLALLQSEHKYIFVLGDYNVDISPTTEIHLATEEFRNILASEHFFPLISGIFKEMGTIIDNIYCNIPSPLEMCQFGILRPYISDHNAICCVFYDTTVSNYQNSCIKRNFCRKNIKKIRKYLKNESWDNIYYSSTQEAFTEFQGLINSYFEKASRNRLLH